jgi:hypothetical protein
VRTAKGKDNIPSEINKHYRLGKRLLVIFDRFSIGSVAPLIANYLKDDYVEFFSPGSFEWLLLSCKMFIKIPDIALLVKNPYDQIPMYELGTLYRKIS